MSLKIMRRANGWSQEQLAVISGISIRTIQRLEAGEAPGLETQKALAAAFDCSVDDLNAQLVATDELGKDTKGDQNILTQYGFKGLLTHLGIMMFVITWLYFLAREFEITPFVIHWIFFFWVMNLLAHAVTLSENKNE